VLSPGNSVQYQVPATLETAGTIELWLKPARFGTGIMNFNWNNSVSAPSAGYVLHLGINAEGKVNIGGWSWDPANMYALASAQSLAIGQWGHVAVSWSAAGARIYVNGA